MKVIKTNNGIIKHWTEGVLFDKASQDQLTNIANMPFIFKWVAAMPDVHLGKGATVGSVIPTMNAIIPAAVGVDIGCFVDTTSVAYVEKGEIKYDSIVNLSKKGEFDTIGYDIKTGKQKIVKATARLTRKNADVIYLAMSNSYGITCTPDHQFLLQNGKYKNAEDLYYNNDYLMVRDEEEVIFCEYSYSLPEKQDVYCLNVPETSNFLLEAGVFVHNCGMKAIKTTIKAHQLPDDLKSLRSAMEAVVPVGMAHRSIYNADEVSKSLLNDYLSITDKYPKIKHKRPELALGTLGGGNHFIEVCLDENQDVWVMLHSGSRGPGNKIGQFFISQAKKEMEKWFVQLSDKDLSYLPKGTELFKDYMKAVHWAQRYAKVNRERMVNDVINVMSNNIKDFDIADEVVDCHHNYISVENHFGSNIYVTRKGAVSAKMGEKGIIPGSMGAKSFIVEGLGNKNSFHSCSHGAGRVMSRTQAKKAITLEQHCEAVSGVECRIDEDVIDESPAAYKNVDDVMKAQEDLVKILYTLKQVLCIKG